jgi:hypothetical protein
MTYNDILSQDELEALLTPEELEAFRAEQQSHLEHEIMLSPAHLLLAVRELGDTVARLTTRVEQLEQQLYEKPLIIKPDGLPMPMVDQELHNDFFESPLMQSNSLTAVSLQEEDDDKQDNIVEIEYPELEDIEEIIPAADLEDSISSESLLPEITPMERSMLLSNEDTVEHDIINTNAQEISLTPVAEIAEVQEGLISRSARHRERKPSLLSKLLR